METDQKLLDVRNFLVHHFGLGPETRSLTEMETGGLAGTVRPDLILEDGQKRFYVEIAPKSGIGKISQLSLYRELLKAEGLDRQDDRFVLLFKTISDNTEAIAEKIGIMTVRAPFNLKLSGFENSAASSKVKLTTKRSWDVIYDLIKYGPASMYQVAKDTGVSYGWVHKVITGLIDLGVATKEYDQVYINDKDKLLNGVAWERPFERMKIAEVWVDDDTAYTVTSNISGNLMSMGVKHTFTGPTAGGIYTGRVIRHDTAYLYLEKENLESFMDTYSSTNRKGIKVKIYAPDRDVFSKSEMIQFVTIVSRKQALLDLAGMGYGYMELTKAMVEYHETP